MIETTRLDNGLVVVTERMPDVRSVTAGFWVSVGSRDEPAERAGASHFLEHLLFKGTDRWSARAIAEEVDGLGGDMNAFTTREYTAFYLRVLDENLDVGLDILCDIMSTPALRAPELETERQVILEELLMHADEPADFVHELFFDALFPDHSIGREVLGDEATVSAMGRDDIADFFATHYGPANLVFAAAGQLDHDDIVASVTRRLDGPTGAAVPDRVAPGLTTVPVVVDEQDTEQVHMVVGYRGLTRHDDDRHALTVLNQVLGGGLSSRLFQEVREKRGLAYSVYSYRAAFQDTGAFGVYAGTAPNRAEEVLALITAEIEAVAADGITERELSLAQRNLVGSLALGLEDSAARMARLGRTQLVHGNVTTIDEVARRYQAVTLDDVARVAKTILASPRTVALVGPTAGLDLPA